MANAPNLKSLNLTRRPGLALRLQNRLRHQVVRHQVVSRVQKRVESPTLFQLARRKETAAMRKFIMLAIAAFIWKKVQARRGFDSLTTKQNRP